MNLFFKHIVIGLFLSSLISCVNTQTYVIAHRGYSDKAPENTLAAFQKAIDIGADYYELDVHKTKDNKLVVIHDKSVDRTCSNNKTGKITELNFTDLQDIRVGFSEKFGETYQNEKIPTLKESLELAKGKIKVCIEIKVKDIEKQVVQLVEELAMVNEVIIFSFNYETVKNTKILNPKLQTLLLIDNANLQTIDKVKAINANAIGVGYNTKITEQLVTYAHQNNIKVFKWTVNKEKEMIELINFKLDGLITNKPDLLLKLK